MCHVQKIAGQGNAVPWVIMHSGTQMSASPLQLHQQTVACLHPVLCFKVIWRCCRAQESIEIVVYVHVVLLPQLLLEFIKIDSILVLNYILNEHEICCAENTKVPSDRIFVWVVNSSIMVVEVKSLVYEQLLYTEKVANVFDSVPILKKRRNVDFCVIGHNMDWHGRWSEGQAA